MSFFKEMDQNKILEILEGHEDTLADRVREELEFVTRNPCPRCGGNSLPELDVMRSLRNGTRNIYHCRCVECGCLYSPYSGLIIEMGNLGQLEPAVPLIHGDKD